MKVHLISEDYKKTKLHISNARSDMKSEINLMNSLDKYKMF